MIEDSRNWDICYCECHTNKCVMHCMPCCSECPNCHQRIKTYLYKEHIEQCKDKIPDPNDLLFKAIEKVFEKNKKEDDNV